VRRMTTRKTKPIPDPYWGMHVTFEEFVGMCKCGAIGDWDGSAEGASETEVYPDSYPIAPSDIMSGRITKEDYTHLVWYNK